MFSSVLGANNAAMTRSAAIASQIGRKRAATSALATTCAERPIVAASATGSLSPGELTDRAIQSGENGEERAATRSPFCAPRPRGVNRDRTHVAFRPPDSNVRRRGLACLNPLQHGQVSTRRRLTLLRGGVYARCTFGSATRPAAGGRARALTHRCSAGQGEWHELAAPRFPERVRRLDGPRHRRDPERRSPRRGRRHRGRRSRPRRIGRGGDRRDRDDRHAGIRGYAPAHLADAGARRPPVLHARQLLRRDARQRRRPLPPRGRPHRELRRLPRGDKRGRDHVARLVAHQQHARPLRRSRPGSEGRRHPGDLRARRADGRRVVVVQRPESSGGHPPHRGDVFLLRRSALDARARGSGAGQLELRGRDSRLGARARPRHPHQRARRHAADDRST